MRAAEERWGGVDGFFNNAGIEGPIAGIPEYPLDDFERVMRVNVTGIFLQSPPMSFFMSKEWCEPLWAIEPAQRNRQHLKKACVQMWNTAGVQAPTPSPIIM